MANDLRFRAELTAFNLPSSYVAYDLETSDRVDSFPIQYGAVKVVDGKVMDTFSTLVSLPPNEKISKGAYSAHHISEKQLIGAPNQEEALINFCSFVGTYPLVGFNNQKFDDIIIDRLANRFQIASPVSNRDDLGRKSQDVMKLYMEFYGSKEKHSLEAACKKYSIKNERAHDASSDAIATHRVYECLISDIKKHSIDVRDIESQKISDLLANENVCVTGGEADLKRYILETAKSMGASLSNNVTKKVTLCVSLTDFETSKTRKASKYSIPVINAYQFFTRVGISEKNIDTVTNTSFLNVWESSLNPNDKREFRKLLDLPITKDLVFAQVKKVYSETLNPYKQEIIAPISIYETSPVSDIRITKEFSSSNTFLLEVKMEDGQSMPLPINSMYFSSMQSESKFMNSTSE